VDTGHQQPPGSAEDFVLSLACSQPLSLVSSQKAVTSANGGAVTSANGGAVTSANGGGEWAGGRSVAQDDEVSKSAKITAD
jgi:hypothetical protein